MKSAFEYHALTLESVPCPICGGSELRQLSKNDRYRMGLTTSGCLNCGLVMTNPRPAADDISTFYAQSYRDFYQNVEVPDATYISRYRKDERARYTADFLELHRPFSSLGNILDFGAGEGSLLREIRSRSAVPALVAIEPSSSFREFARNYVPCAAHRAINDLPEGERFEFVIINHVLEHTLNPVESLREARDLLSGTGMIFVDVPAIEFYTDVSSLHLAHLFHFSARTLQLAARAARLQILFCEYHFPPAHPGSFRCVLSKEPAHINAEPPSRFPMEMRNWRRIRIISRMAWLYYLKHSGIRGRVQAALGKPLLKLFG